MIRREWFQIDYLEIILKSFLKTSLDFRMITMVCFQIDYIEIILKSFLKPSLDFRMITMITALNSIWKHYWCIFLIIGNEFIEYLNYL